ncbi:MAG TPA: hypothetical protein VGB36_00235 [Gammaproteobacteria bacterium]
MEKRRKMALVGAAHGQRNFGYRQIRGPEKLLGARHAAPDYVLVRRKPGRLLENMCEMIWVQLERCGHLDERQSLTEVAVNEANNVLHSLCRGNISFGHESPLWIRIKRLCQRLPQREHARARRASAARA